MSNITSSIYDFLKSNIVYIIGIIASIKTIFLKNKTNKSIQISNKLKNVDIKGDYTGGNKTSKGSVKKKVKKK